MGVRAMSHPKVLVQISQQGPIVRYKGCVFSVSELGLRVKGHNSTQSTLVSRTLILDLMTSPVAPVI